MMTRVDQSRRFHFRNRRNLAGTLMFCSHEATEKIGLLAMNVGAHNPVPHARLMRCHQAVPMHHFFRSLEILSAIFAFISLGFWIADAATGPNSVWLGFLFLDFLRIYIRGCASVKQEEKAEKRAENLITVNFKGSRENWT